MPRFRGVGKNEDVVGRSVKFRGAATSNRGLQLPRYRECGSPLAADAFSSPRSGVLGSVRCAHSEDKSSALAPLFGERLGDETAPDEAPIRRFTGGSFFPPQTPAASHPLWRGGEWRSAVASWSSPTRFCARKRAGIVRVPWPSTSLCRCGSTGRDSYPAQQAVRVPWNRRPFVPLVEALRATVFGRTAPFNCACNAQCGR